MRIANLKKAAEVRVLIVRKRTNFELHGDRVRKSIQAGYRPPTDIESLQMAHDQHYSALDTLLENLHRAGVPCDSILRDESWPNVEYDAIVTVGGDGTLLTTSHQVVHIPLVGIRSSDASVGYTCAYHHQQIKLFVSDLLQSKIDYRQVSRLQVTVEHLQESRVESSFPILNDALLTSSNPAATSQYSLSINGIVEIQKSSGIWIATSTGSTAAILAAGGQESVLSDKRFQFRVRELYRIKNQDLQLCGHFFDPDKDTFVIEVRNESALVALDGQHGSMHLRYGDRITVQRAPSLHLAKPPHMRWS